MRPSSLPKRLEERIRLPLSTAYWPSLFRRRRLRRRKRRILPRTRRRRKERCGSRKGSHRMASVYSVSQVTAYIKNMFTQDFALNRISIKGEVSNCKYHTSGHIYFTLKDGGAQIAAVMF